MWSPGGETARHSRDHSVFCDTKESRDRGLGRGEVESLEAGELSQGLDSRGRSPRGLAGGESVGVCHRVSERFREMTNRKPLTQQ